MVAVLERKAAFDRDVANYERQRLAVFAGFVDELALACNSPEDADFTRVIKHAQFVLGKTDMQMSALFKVSRPTIGRWVRGVTAPHPMLRKAVFDVLLAEAKQAFKSLRQIH